MVAIINRGEKREISLPLFLLPKNSMTVVEGRGEAYIEEDYIRINIENKESLLLRLENWIVY